MGFNSAFKGLIIELGHARRSKSYVEVSELILSFRTVIGIQNCASLLFNTGVKLGPTDL
jgi:hypothetical protein